MNIKSGLWLMTLVLCAKTQTMAQTTNDGFGAYPPAPKAEPLTETLHGVKISDPYRWMESPDRREEMVAWVKASSAQTTSTLAKLPGRAPLLKALEDASRVGAVHSNVKLAGGRMFFLELASDANIPVLKVRENGSDRLFLDPMVGAPTGSHRTINNYMPSPDGKLVAIHTADGGGEVGATRFYDVVTHKVLDDVLTPIWGEFTVNWLDDKTVTYTRMNLAERQEDAMENMTVFVHHLGTPMSSDSAVEGSKVGAGFPMSTVEFPIVRTRQRSHWAIAESVNARADERVAFTSFASLITGKPKWKPLADYDDKVNDIDLVGDILYYLTTAHDPKGEIRSIDLDTGTLASSRLVLAAKGAVLKRVIATTAGVYVAGMAPDASSRLFFIPNAASKPVEVPMPVVGSISDTSVTPDGRTLTVELDGIEKNVTYYRLSAASMVPLGLADPTIPAAAGITLVEENGTSVDGTAVPLTIVAPKGPVKPLPTLLGAYAGYGISLEPYYSSSNVVWVARGSVMAECHARGGGEKGRTWHEAGRSANKVNAMDDVIACGERLIQLGYTTPKLMALWGGSAGGLVVTPVGLKRPDLFAAIVTRVGVVNATRIGVANNGPNQFAEMGDPNIDAGFKALAAQDSTLLLAEAKGGTDQLFTIGLNDHRVDPWMSAKLVAMMRAKWGDQHLVLIRSDADVGHGIGSTRDQTLEERADIFAFLLNRFGQPGFTPSRDTPTR
jgi:prolyl oligopeptidase